MKIEAHIICFNELEILPFTIRHYLRFCSAVVIHDMGSTDGSVEQARVMGCEIVQHDCGGEFDDRLNQRVKNTSWLGRGADWVIQADADELIYFPYGAEATLAAYDKSSVAVAKPYGYEMTSDVFPTGDGQIYDEVKSGGRDDKWYAKPVIFSGNRVAEIAFGMGAHVCTAKLNDGTALSNPTTPSAPSCFLLHFHHIGPIERIAKKYDDNLARRSQANIKGRWGNFEPGIKHATDKRNMILSKIERVIA